MTDTPKSPATDSPVAPPHAAPAPPTGPRWGAVAALLLALVPPLLALNLIGVHWVNIPFWDEWDLSEIVCAYHEGTLHLSSFFALHMEHRIVFTRVLFLVNEIVFAGNRLPLLLLSFAAQCATLTLLLRQMRRLVSARAGLVLTVVLSALLFPLAAVEVWLWAFLIQHTLAILFFALAVFALPVPAADPAAPPPSLRPTLWAGVWMVCAIYSSGSALILIGLLPLLAALYRLPRPHLYATLAASLFCAATYLGDYHPDKLPPGRFVVHTSDRLAYFFAFLGATTGERRLDASVQMGIMTALLLVAVVAGAVWWWRRTGDTRLAPWLALAALPLGTALAGAMNRVDMGVTQALSSRYTLLSALVWGAIVVGGAYLLPRLPKPVRRGAWLASLAAGLVVVVLYVDTARAYESWETAFASRRATAAALLERGNSEEWVTRELYPYRPRMIELLARHRRNGMLPYRKSPSVSR